MSAHLRLIRRSPLATIGLVILTLWLTSITFAPLITPYSPLRQDLVHRLWSPSGLHLFGTDNLGRDVFSRILYGGRVSIPIGLVVIAITCIIGTTIGSLAGFIGGWFDEVSMRVADVFLAFPPILLALAIAAALGPDLQNAVLALVTVWWPQYARMMRGVTLQVKQSESILAARAIGASSAQILVRVILPNAFPPVLVFATLDIGSGIIAAASLSYLGLGVRPPTPEWGAMVSQGAQLLEQWWLAAFPGLAILSVVMGFNFIGDSIRDALDPRLVRT